MANPASHSGLASVLIPACCHPAATRRGRTGALDHLQPLGRNPQRGGVGKGRGTSSQQFAAAPAAAPTPRAPLPDPATLRQPRPVTQRRLPRQVRQASLGRSGSLGATLATAGGPRAAPPTCKPASKLTTLFRPNRQISATFRKRAFHAGSRSLPDRSNTSVGEKRHSQQVQF